MKNDNAYSIFQFDIVLTDILYKIDFKRSKPIHPSNNQSEYKYNSWNMYKIFVVKVKKFLN